MPNSTKPEFRFLCDTHQYFLGEKELPSVSHILKITKLGKDNDNIPPFFRERGIAGHLCVELHLKDQLDESTIDPELVPFFDGFKAFIVDHPIKPLFIEQRRYNESWGFAGTMDLIAEDAIYDWKFSKNHDRVAELQGQGYKILTHETHPNLPFKVVQFPGDGSYEIFDYGNKTDTWPHVMEIYKWKTTRRPKS